MLKKISLTFNLICMKNLLILVFSLMSIQSFSQGGNLQFNSVLNDEVLGSVVGNNGQVGDILGTITVPAGKVWKIESTSAFKINPTADAPQNLQSAMVFVDNHWVVGVDGGGATPTFPIWLKEGPHQVKIQISDASSVVSFSYSGIEFNVVP